MSAIAPTGFVPLPVFAQTPALELAASPTDRTFPTPLLEGLEPRDALSVMMMAMERSSRASVASSEDKIRATREQIGEQLDKYLEQLRASIAAAQEDDDGGWFGSIVNAVADAVGAVVGVLADVFCDYITFPLEATIDIAKNFRNPGAILAALQSDLADFGRTGEAGQAVKGFARGVTKVVADLSAFAAKLTVALGKASATGADVWEAVKDEAKQLGKSINKNILSNDDFWKVVSAAAKAGAIAATAASGGTLSIVAVALIALTEVDARTNLIEKAFGEGAAPWVRGAIQLGAVVAGAFAGPGQLSQLGRTISSVTTVAQGAGAITQGVRAKLAADARAAEVDQQAELTATLNRMQQLQRLCESLIDVLSNKEKDHTKNQQLASDLVQTQAATEAAVVVQG